MKSCLVVTKFAPSQPGYLDFAYRIRSLASRYKVTLLSTHTLDVEEVHIAGMEHLFIPSGRSFKESLAFMWKAASHAKKHKFDLIVLLHSHLAPMVHFLENVPHALYWNEHPSRFLSPQSIWPIRQWRKFKLNLYMQAASCAQLIMPIGEAHRDDLVARGCRRERIRMIYMGVDDSFDGVALDSPDKAPAKNLRLLYTGSVHKDRGRDIMIEAIAQARADGVPVQLTIVGADPEQLSYCRQYVARLGVQDAVHVVGRVPGSEIPSYIGRADAGLCIMADKPYWRFNPPTKLFEYLVAGLPVLASDINTHTHYISHWGNGLIFEYDAVSLAKAIGTLWQCRDELPALKMRAYESGRPYLWSRIEPEFLALMESLIEHGQSEL